jgi:hypothetical protein
MVEELEDGLEELSVAEPYLETFMRWDNGPEQNAVLHQKLCNYPFGYSSPRNQEPQSLSW